MYEMGSRYPNGNNLGNFEGNKRLAQDMLGDVQQSVTLK